MGIFDKIKAKIAGSIEKSAVSQMSEEEKAKYEAERAALKPAEPNAPLTLKYTKDETSDLEALLAKLGVLDERKVWIGGFLKQRSNTNAKFANLFSGHKNLRFLCVNKEEFYMVRFDEDIIKTYKDFRQENVAGVSKAPQFSVKLFDKTSMTLEVTKNKQKVNELFALLKAK